MLALSQVLREQALAEDAREAVPQGGQQPGDRLLLERLDMQHLPSLWRLAAILQGAYLLSACRPRGARVLPALLG